MKIKNKRLLKKGFKRVGGVILFVISMFIINSIFIKNKNGLLEEMPTLDVFDDNNVANQEDWNLLLVNKWNKIPENYKPNLVEVAGGEKVDKRIYESLMALLEAAKVKNWGQMPTIASGYRTYEKQKQLYEDKIKSYRNKGYSKEKAKEEAEKWVAIPGYSEHQLGLAVDINGATYDLYLWLQDNSYKYGFIFRYKGDKTNITKTAEEVWHYRYVGVEEATEIYEKNLCLEEYLEIKNK